MRARLVRCFTTAAADGGGVAARMKALSDTVNKGVAGGVASLAQAYGGAERCESMWASEYYRHREHKYLVPALTLGVKAAVSEGGAGGSPALLAKHAVFYSTALRGLGEAEFMGYVNTLPLVHGLHLGTLLDVLRAVGTVQGRVVFDRLTASVAKSGGEEAGALVAHARAVPFAHAPEWPFPHLDASLARAASVGDWKPSPGEAPRVYELTGMAPHLRDMCDGPTWLLLTATTVLECQWAHFYATGDTAPLHRVLQAALPWASTQASSLPGAPTYLVDLEKPLPPAFTLKEGDTPAQSLKCIQAAVARAALWSLLMHSRRHPAVTRAIARACGDLAPFVAEPSARGGWSGEGGGSSPATATTGALPALTEEEVRDRMEVWPPLLHLCARGRLDAPWKEGDKA